MTKFIKLTTIRANSFFERYWLPILLLTGILSVNPESGIILALYLFYFIKLIEYSLQNKLPKPSFPQLFLIFGTTILGISQYVFLNNLILNFNLINWVVL